MCSGFLEVAKSRRSVRSFTGQPVSPELLNSVIEAALWAPRAGNRQHWRIIVVQSADSRQQLADAVGVELARQRVYLKSERALRQFDAYTGHFLHFASAPLLLVLVARPYDSIYSRMVAKVPDASMGELLEPGVASAMMAAENLLLAAAAQSLGGCFLSGPLVAQKAIERILGVAPPEHAVGFITLGYPAAGAADTHIRQETVQDVVTCA